MSLLEIRNLDVRHGLLQAVRDLSLSVEKGETIALVGANGAGKTTLLRTIAGAHMPAGGSVVFNGIDITTRPIGALASASRWCRRGGACSAR